MAAKRKQVSMVVTVSVPKSHGAADARRQVRDILKSELTWDEHMKMIAVRNPSPAIRHDLKLRQKRLRELRTTPPLLAAMGAK